MQVHVTVGKAGIDGFQSQSKAMSRVLLRWRKRSIVREACIDVTHVATGRCPVARKAGVTDNRNMGTGLVHGLLGPAPNGRVRVGNRLRGIRIIFTAQAHRSLALSLHPKIMVHHYKTSAEEIA